MKENRALEVVEVGLHLLESIGCVFLLQQLKASCLSYSDSTPFSTKGGIFSGFKKYVRI